LGQKQNNIKLVTNNQNGDKKKIGNIAEKIRIDGIYGSVDVCLLNEGGHTRSQARYGVEAYNIETKEKADDFCYGETNGLPNVIDKDDYFRIALLQSIENLTVAIKGLHKVDKVESFESFETK